MKNYDQKALAKWISAGLQIEEVLLLHGDTPYLLSNMIAKYSLAADQYLLSAAALNALLQQGVDLDKVHKRSRFYGKTSMFIYEHSVPASLVRAELLKCGGSLDAVLEILRSAGPVAMLLRTEDDALSGEGFRARMPDGWKWGDDPLARYHAAKIGLVDQTLKVTGKIKR